MASDCHLVADEVIYCKVKQRETFEVFVYYTKNIINTVSLTLLCDNIYLYLYFFFNLISFYLSHVPLAGHHSGEEVVCLRHHLATSGPGPHLMRRLLQVEPPVATDWSQYGCWKNKREKEEHLWGQLMSHSYHEAGHRISPYLMWISKDSLYFSKSWIEFQDFSCPESHSKCHFNISSAFICGNTIKIFLKSNTCIFAKMNNKPLLSR